jgi:hypothetical protein
MSRSEPTSVSADCEGRGRVFGGSVAGCLAGSVTRGRPQTPSRSLKVSDIASLPFPGFLSVPTGAGSQRAGPRCGSSSEDSHRGK